MASCGASGCEAFRAAFRGVGERGDLLCEGPKGGGLVAHGWALHELVDSLAELLRQGRNVLPNTVREVRKQSKESRSQRQHSSTVSEARTTSTVEE